MRVSALIASLRSRITTELFFSFISLEHTEEYENIIYKLGSDQRIANSEALVLAAMIGAKEVGAQCNLVKLNEYFQNEKIDLEKLFSVMENSQGFVLSTPVYFGDRSSFLGAFIESLKKYRQDLPFDNKAVGIVSVGAKRNGGQETANIYALWECLQLGASIVGNGPPTSQYGGTGWAGNLGSIIDDNFGLMTSRGTGRRVALLSFLLSSDELKQERVKFLFLITRSDREESFIDFIKSLKGFSKNVTLDILDITKLKIRRCRACAICPYNQTSLGSYGCVILDDDMPLIYNKLIEADCIVLSHYCGADPGPDKFQLFMERTRFIRRNNFELANRIFSFCGFTDSFLDIFPLRAMTSFLRHNLFIVGPFYQRYIDKTRNFYLETIPINNYLKRLEVVSRKAKIFRKNQRDTFLTYIPIGY